MSRGAFWLGPGEEPTKLLLHNVVITTDLSGVVVQVILVLDYSVDVDDDDF